MARRTGGAPLMARMLRTLIERLARHRSASRPAGPPTGTAQAAADRLIALGNQAEDGGRPADACVHYRAAVAAAPQYAKAHLNLGIGLSASGDRKGAVAALQAALVIEPGNPYAHYNLGRVLMTGGSLHDAEHHLRAALEHKADFAEALVILAAVLEANGAAAEAAEALERALVYQPGNFGALYRYGTLLIARGRLVEAEDALRRACTADPASVDANLQLATLLKGRNALPEAERHLRRVLELMPAHDEARATLFHVLQTQGNLPAALAEIETLLLQQPDRVDALYNYGLLLKNLRRLGDAEAAFERVIAIDGGFVLGHKMLASVLLSQTRIDEALEVYAAARARNPQNLELQSAELFALNFCERITDQVLFERHRHFGECIEAAYPARSLSFANSPDPDRRLRIGYVSGDFCFHVVALFMLPLLERHDRSAFEIHCYSVGDRYDEYSRKLSARADVWHDASSLSEKQLAELVESDGIDILVDLSGHSGISQLELFARQPAPVQAAWLGYLNTTGLTRIQYRICDRYSDPPGTAEQIHTERLVRLPYSQWCYRPFINVAPADGSPCNRNGFVTYGSFAQPAKLSPGVRRLWSEILSRVPESRLVVSGVSDGMARETLSRDFANAGIESPRIAILPYRALDDYFASFRDVDIALDTFPYSGGTTTCDTLWMGVPVVTLPGARPPSRSAASVLSAVGLGDWIAATPEDYVRMAVERAGDRDGLARLRGSLRVRMRESPLMDEPGFARDLEHAYREMWIRWCRTDGPRGENGTTSTGLHSHPEDQAAAHAARYEHLHRAGRFTEALSALEAALERQPDWADARYNYGVSLLAAGRLDESEAALRRVLALDPKYAPAYRMLGNILHRLSRIDGLIELCRTGRKHLPERFDLESFELLALNFSESISAHDLFDRHRAFGERLERVVSPIAESYANGKDVERRLRVAFVSGEFSCHPVTLFMLPLLEHHDRAKIEIFCYSSGDTEDEYTRNVRRYADGWRDARALTDRELAEVIQSDGVDVAVDLSGHSGISRLATFAHRPAPVQMAWLGYLNTTGLTRIQYRVCDRHSDPPGVADGLHTERLLRLPSSQWCYRPFLAVAPVPFLPSERSGCITFGSFNQAAKVSAPVRRAWAEILARLPSARLAVFGISEGRASDELLRDLSGYGIDATRITLTPHLPLNDYYRAIGSVDIALDTFPYSGGTTTCDTLWMGVPVLTLPGERPPSRSAASVLRTLGLDDWVAATREEYVRLAVERAGDREGLAHLRGSLRARMRASPLMDESGFARDFERLLRGAWHNWCRGAAN